MEDRLISNAMMDEYDDPEGVARLVGPVGQRALVLLASQGGVEVSWKAWRVGVVEWMERFGLEGVLLLMRNAMGSLWA